MMDKNKLKIIVSVQCNHCESQIESELSLIGIFEALQKKIPGAKGPIESIYSLIEKEQEKSNKQIISLNV